MFQPPINSEDKSIDKMIADELSGLSIKEREKVYEDVHGVLTQVEETPDLVFDSLIQLDKELDSIPSKEAYNSARNISEEYVCDRKFRLSFLRAEYFEVKKAASRMVRYFENKLYLFGTEKLTKNIGLDDMDENDMNSMEAGVIQILPQRDTSDRAVVVAMDAFHLSAYFSVDPARHVLKCWWYIMSSAVEDEETQRRGIVYICYGIDGQHSLNLDVDTKVWFGCCGLAQCLPLRISCAHYCYNDIRIMPLITVVASSVGRNIRARIRKVYGTHMECNFKLLTYGIPVQLLPISSDNKKIKLANHQKWIKRRRQKEYTAKLVSTEGRRSPFSTVIASGVELPSRFDVLLGKGRPCQEYYGNKRLHDIIACHYDEYNNAERRDKKSKIADQLVNVIKASPGRFLKRDEKSGLWVEVNDKEAREKVCHGLRRKREFDSKRGKKQVKPETVISMDQRNKRLKIPDYMPYEEDSAFCLFRCDLG